MKVKIEFSVDNEAFGNHPELETSRILRSIASGIEEKDWFKIASGNRYIRIRDFNGNEIGFFAVGEFCKCRL